MHANKRELLLKDEVYWVVSVGMDILNAFQVGLALNISTPKVEQNRYINKNNIRVHSRLLAVNSKTEGLRGED